MGGHESMASQLDCSLDSNCNGQEELEVGKDME
jgi:hypothetical protein